MNAKLIAGIGCGLLVGCCLYVHRNAIAAAVKGEEMPMAPKWHCWVPKEMRRG